MLKKYLFAFLFVVTGLLSLNANAMSGKVEYKEGVNYITLKQPVENVPDVLLFFSFYCPHCYVFETQYHIADQLQQSLPKGVSFAKYHIDDIGPLGSQLSKAWVIADQYNLQAKVEPLLFSGIQKENSIASVADIRNVFVKAGLDGKSFDGAINSFIVDSLANKQQQAKKDLFVTGVPALYVKGKYQILYNNFNAEDPTQFTNSIKDITNYLLTK